MTIVMSGLVYRIFPERRLIFERLTGHVSTEGLMALTGDIWADEGYDKSFDIIVDVRDAVFGMRASSIEAFAELVLASENALEGRAAIISAKPVETALSYLFSRKLSEKSPMAVFSTWDAVVDFLGLPVSMLAELSDEKTYEALFR